MVKERLESDRSSGWLREVLMAEIGGADSAVAVVAVVVLVEGGRR